VARINKEPIHQMHCTVQQKSQTSGR